MIPPSNWSNEITNELRSLWTSGCSAEVIANELNKKFRTTFSRNAVIGKVHRLALEARVERGLAKADRDQPGARIRARDGPDQEPLKQSAAFVCLPPLLNHDDHPTLVELHLGACRWPVGDGPPMIFCGEWTGHARLSYCEHHHNRAYQRG
jgi:hypothetical protein